MISDTDPLPDFRWPYRVVGFLVEYVSDLWDLALYKLNTELPKTRSLYAALRVAVLVFVGYLVTIWLSLCYVYFPVRPYSLAAFFKWAVMATAVIWGGVCLYIAAAQIFVFAGLLLMIAASLLLSLGYLCWLVWCAQRRNSAWLQHYRNSMLISTITVVLLATFVDGSYRFWDKPFHISTWAIIVFLGLSAWAALFCFLLRNAVLTARRPIVRWTLSISLLIGALVYLQTRHDGPEHFLRKAVVEHPNDMMAWLKLASHYQDQGDALASDSGDEDHAPPDPTPSYRAALDCFNRGVDLGAKAFEVDFARAQLADAVGDKRASVSFAQEALSHGSSRIPDGDRNEEVKWLLEMISRNAGATDAQQADDDRERMVRDERRNRLPRIVRWAVDVF